MYHLDDPEDMTPDERFKEVAGIFALGYLRLEKRPPSLHQLDDHNNNTKNVSSVDRERFRS